MYGPKDVRETCGDGLLLLCYPTFDALNTHLLIDMDIGMN